MEVEIHKDGVSILIVENEPGHRRLMQLLIQRAIPHGCRCDFAPDGQSALDNAADGAYSLILLDLHMPGMDGFEVIERLRACGVTAPVVAVTAADTPGLQQQIRKAGFDALLLKPIEMQDLRKIVQRTVSHVCG